MHDDRTREALAPFFAAARRDAPPAPDVALMNRILADAAQITAARVPAEKPAPPARDGLAARLRRLFAPLGGLPAAAALGVCAMLGLTTGMLGAADAGTAALWSLAQSDDEAAAAVLAFYDLESPEG